MEADISLPFRSKIFGDSCSKGEEPKGHLHRAIRTDDPSVCDHGHSISSNSSLSTTPLRMRMRRMSDGLRNPTTRGERADSTSAARDRDGERHAEHQRDDQLVVPRELDDDQDGGDRTAHHARVVRAHPDDRVRFGSMCIDGKRSCAP